MKIHIVQKGDTLWKIAQKYGVDFEELKQLNTQLSNPDMLMPGMKVKIPTSAVPAKKEAPKTAAKKEMPKKVPSKMEMLKGTPKEMPKKEAPKEMPKEMAKTEMAKTEVPKEMPKAGLPKKDMSKVGSLLDEMKPLVKEVLKEMKPEIINELKLELEMTNINQLSVEQVKPFHPTPPPAPKAHMPLPYMPKEKHPCPPYPSCPPKPASHGHHYGQHMGYGVSPTTQYPTAQMPTTHMPVPQMPHMPNMLGGTYGSYGYGMPMGQNYPSYPGQSHNPMMNGREAGSEQNDN